MVSLKPEPKSAMPKTDLSKAFEEAISAEENKLVGTKTLNCESMPLDENGDVWFHAGQKRAWESVDRIIAIIAGAQSGKTIFGPEWLEREIQRTATPIKSAKDKPNDYLVAGPTLRLLKNKAIPAFMFKFRKYGKLDQANNIFNFSPKGSKELLGFVAPITIFFGYAANPESLESMTAKAVWLDEAGQEGFKLASYRAIQRRMSTTGGRILITTTPYELGWLKDEVYDKCLEGEAGYCLVNFKTTDNPAISGKDEDGNYINPEAMKVIEDARRDLPDWQFKMFHEGIFTRPAGAIYECFDDTIGPKDGDTNVCDPFDIPPNWPRLLGQDFGDVHMGSVFLAEDPDSDYVYIYGARLDGNMSISSHVERIKEKGFRLHASPKHEVVQEFELACGGSWSENDYRKDFILCGLDITRPPVREVEVGILRVYSMLKTRRLKVFSDCKTVQNEIKSYSRKVNDYGEPVREIKDKEKYHRIDALRYIVLKQYPAATMDMQAFGSYNDPGPPRQ
jgi:hypothetical protein